MKIVFQLRHPENVLSKISGPYLKENIANIFHFKRWSSLNCGPDIKLILRSSLSFFIITIASLLEDIYLVCNCSGYIQVNIWKMRASGCVSGGCRLFGGR